LREDDACGFEYLLDMEMHSRWWLRVLAEVAQEHAAVVRVKTTPEKGVAIRFVQQL
jgi:hypothetical protein